MSISVYANVKISILKRRVFSHIEWEKIHCFLTEFIIPNCERKCLGMNYWNWNVWSMGQVFLLPSVLFVFCLSWVLFAIYMANIRQHQFQSNFVFNKKHSCTERPIQIGFRCLIRWVMAVKFRVLSLLLLLHGNFEIDRMTDRLVSCQWTEVREMIEYNHLYI